MMHRRFPVILVVLLVIGLLVLGSNMIRQNAWNEGYMMGRLAAGGETGTALPYGYPGSFGPSHFSGVGMFFGLLLLGLLGLMAFRYMRHRGWQMAGKPGGPEGEEHGHSWRHHIPPWCWPEERPAEGQAEPAKTEEKKDAES
jgi:hypothetical protein